MPTYYETHYKISSGLPRPVKNALIVYHMARDKGLSTTAANISKQTLARLHFIAFDRALNDRLPVSTSGNVRLEDLSILESSPPQDTTESFYAPSPTKTILWSLAALPIEPERFTFLDCGSGLGFALTVAAQLPFKRVAGVEFSKELYKSSLSNIAAAKLFPETRCHNIDATLASVLSFDIPKDPLVVFMFNPFNPDVMKPWLERLQQSVAEAPREVWIVYVNPQHREVFESVSDLHEVEMGNLAQLKLGFASPYAVKFYRFN
jgi:hypothetical protein